MATDIVLRSIKAAALTHAEMDQNWESLAQTVDAVLADYTVLVTDQNKLLECDIASGTITLLTLADAAGTDTDSFRLIIKNANATNLTITGNGGETIEGAAFVQIRTNETISLSLSGDANLWMVTSYYNTSTIGLTASAAELNTLDGITATVTELNTLDGITATVTELNTLDGITATVTELNYSDGVTSAIQPQLNNKQPLDSDLTAIAALSNANSNFIVGNGSSWVAETGATARSSLGVDPAGTDNSTDVTLAGTPNYITIAGQTITRALVSLTSHITGILPLANGGTNSSTAAGAVSNLGFTATTAEINAICDGKTLTSSDDKIDNFPANTRMLFRQTNAPTGWTKLTDHNDKALRLVSGAIMVGGTQPFTTTFGSGKTSDNHVLTIAEMPSHDHQTRYYSSGTSGTTAAITDNSSIINALSPNTALTGGGGGHTHPLTNFDLQYVDTIEATKD